MFDGDSSEWTHGARPVSCVSDEPKPVFLHAGWRCGSTYLWSKFRRAVGTTCFYEPFSEQLRHLTPGRIRRNNADAWTSRHPPLDRPYFDEYGDVLEWRGVRGFHERFALERYFAGDDGARDEVAYLRGLVALGRERDAAPVFGFSRSLARVGMLRRAFGGAHVVIRRNPVQQWLSCRSYRVLEQSDYFEACHFLILALAPPGSEGHALAQRLGIPRPPVEGIKRQLRWLRAALGGWSDELSYRVFRSVYALSYRAATEQADCVLDVDELTRCPRQRAAAAAALERHTGFAIGLDDCRVPQRDAGRLGLDFEAIDATVEREVGLGVVHVPLRRAASSTR